ncbi:sulfotransferase family 2 domain-containing protein [Paracoccus ravus]|uniref:sulfotransferase family 2 domain-containing protein n=1 Tax=Paracoccus ravus TaxID=2447760 RepID=UPI001431F3F3|nr:sulfotransferase family 2 domain-containing protein [Paracoccus ravus]
MNFLFPDRGVVFIHIPKNAGTSIRTALGKRSVGPVAGAIPEDWIGLPSLAVIRHPTDRFLSAVNMFRCGARAIASSDHYHEARLPGLTVSQALDALEDPTIGFDRSFRHPLHNLKHHMWPQTDAFNCLALARHILRFENLEEDFERFCAAQGIDAELPFTRHTTMREGSLTADDLTAAELDRIATFFRADFDQLGYQPDDFSWSDARPIKSQKDLDAEEVLAELWPSYFENAAASDAQLSVLPSSEVNLELFATSVIPGRTAKGWNHRRKDLLDHFRHLEPEFAGKPRLCHLLACTIVVLRRDEENAAARRLFNRIVREHSAIATHLNSRWLTSVCDTLVDVGETDLDRVLGMTGSLFSNSMKLIETEIRLFYPPRPWPPKKIIRRGGALYDGMITFWIERGDAIENLLDRVEKALSVEADAAFFVREIINRVISNDTALSRIMALAGQAPLSVIRKDRLERLRKSLADL